MRFKENIICSCCKKKIQKNKSVIKLKKLPITDILLKKPKIFKNYRLDQSVMFCENCEHLFLKNHIDPDLVYNRSYPLSSSKTFSSIKANEDFYKFISSNLKNSKPKKIIEVGSNDLYLLKKFYKKGRKLVGIDPVIKSDKKFKQIKTIKEFFFNVSNSMLDNNFDLIICGHTLEHVENPDLFLEKILSISGKNTKIFFQFPSLESLVLNASFDQIHHQHLNIFSLNSFEKILKKYKGKIINYSYNESHFGALMIYFTLNSSKIKRSKNLKLPLKIKSNLISDAYNNFKTHLKALERTILNYIKHGRKFYVVAAAGLLPILNYHMNKIMNKADAILDDDSNKIGKFFPGIKPKIISMKKTDLKNSICLIGSVNSHITTRKIANVLIDKQAGIILLPAITF